MYPLQVNIGPAMRAPRLCKPENRKHTQELPVLLGALLAIECSQTPLSPLNETRWSFLPNIIDLVVNMDYRESARIYRLQLLLGRLPRQLSRLSAGYSGSSCARHRRDRRCGITRTCD